MNNDDTMLALPVQELLVHLHSQGLSLPPDFNKIFIPMIGDQYFTADEEYTCIKTKDGVLDRAKWISSGYGYAVSVVEDKEGVKIELIVKIFRPKTIMLHENGFFNNQTTDYIYRLTKGTTAVPFARSQFVELASSVPESSQLAVKILSKQHDEEAMIIDILKMRVDDKKTALEAHFGIGIYQHFSKKDLAPYFGMAPETMSRH